MGFFVSGWFPCGMQIYWLTSNLMTLLINSLLYLDPVRQIFGIQSKKIVNEIEAPPSNLFGNPLEKEAPPKPFVDPKQAAKLMKQRTKSKHKKKQNLRFF